MKDYLDGLDKDYVEKFDFVFNNQKYNRIVLYGIGYRTGAIISSLKDYNFIGLMDRDPCNVGKIMYGLKIMDTKEVIEKASCIIIISASYWDIIFRRISFINEKYNIPIFYPNGEKAKLSSLDNNIRENKYWNISMLELKNEINNYDVISFDIFDTIIMRKTLLPEDIFDLVELKLKSKGINVEFKKLRKQAEGSIINAGNKYPTIDDIYIELKQIFFDENIIINDLQNIKELEIHTEITNIVAREDICSIYNYAIELEKKVYFISDMYLSKSILKNMLKRVGIQQGYEDIIVSCERKASKSDLSLWIYFNKLVEDKKALHIGDNYQTDIINAKRNGIDAFYIMSGYDMLKNSSLGFITSNIKSSYDSILTGNIVNKMFNSPFALNESKGIINIDCFENLGYIGFGMLIFSYLFWIIQNCKEHNIEKLFFFARDGYFLKDDFDYIKEFLEEVNIGSEYLKISRQLIMNAAIINNDDIKQCIKVAYTGTLRNYMKLRFDFEIEKDMINDEEIVMPRDFHKVEKFIEYYRNSILERAFTNRNNYLNYLQNIDAKFYNCATVDLGYSGSTQWYLSKIIKHKLIGFYYIANMCTSNIYNEGQEKYSFTYDKSDPRGDNSIAIKLQMILESVFTAPEGSYIKCNDIGKFETNDKCMNQLLFDKKIQINNGIKEFIKDAIINFVDLNIEDIFISNKWASYLLDKIFSENCNIKKEIKDTFYGDDIFRIKTDNKILE